MADELDPTEIPTRAPIPAPGVSLAGQALHGYALLREIGRGATSKVYEARETATGRTLAVKVMEVAGTGYNVDMALREARLMAKVTHPNTVFLYSAEQTGSGLLLAMELMGGGTLSDLLAQEGMLPVRRAVDIALQLIQGLKALEEHGIVHRDIKPSNCFLAQDGTAKVGDLGLSRSAEMVSRMTQEGRFVGTPLYSSPEQLRGEPVDRRSDIYSLAATLYEMLSGHPPIEALDGISLVARIMTDEPEPLSRRVDGLPEGLDRAVGRALAKDPRQRFATYAEVETALLPFGSRGRAWAAGKQGMRVLAFFVDVQVLSWLLLGLGAGLAGLRRIFGVDSILADVNGAGNLAWPTLALAVVLAYYGLLEGSWGRSLGKSIVGLQVIDSSGSRPGVVRALIRAGLIAAPTILLPVSGIVLSSWLLTLIAMVSTMRPANGYQGLYEKLTATRVIYNPWWSHASRPGGVKQWLGPIFRFLHQPLRVSRRPPSSPVVSRTASRPVAERGVRHFGSFFGEQRLSADERGTLWSAEDTVLERKLWVYEHAGPEGQLRRARQELRRPTRLRWVAGTQEGTDRWDAFVAPGSSTTLLSLGPGTRRRPWQAARRIVGRLAAELMTAEGDGTLPATLSLAQVCLLPDDRLLLLDTPLEPEGTARSERFSVDAAGMRSFLQVLVTSLLDGTVVPASEARTRAPTRWPVRDQELLVQLWGSRNDMRELLARMAEVLSAELPAGTMYELTRWDRVKQMMAVSVLFLIPALMAQLIPHILADPSKVPSPWPFLFATLIPCFVLALAGGLFRGGPLLAWDRILVCNIEGLPANRGRCYLRSLALWLLLWPHFALALVSGYYPELPPPAASLLARLTLGHWLLMGIGMVYSSMRPSRGVPDLIARTYLRPR